MSEGQNLNICQFESRAELFGAFYEKKNEICVGTLGCNVARVLIGWGVRTITFVDSGTGRARQILSKQFCELNAKLYVSMKKEILKFLWPFQNFPFHTVISSTISWAQSAIQTQFDNLFLLLTTRSTNVTRRPPLLPQYSVLHQVESLKNTMVLS